MANTLSVSPFNVSSTISGSGRLQVLDQFKALPGESFPLLSVTGYGSPTKLEDSYKVRWVLDEYLPIKAVLNEALDSSETGVDVTSATAATVQNGQVIRIDDELMRVTSGAGTTTWTVERDYAGSTAATHSSGADIRIMAPAYEDDDTFVESAKLRGQFTQNYPIQCMYKVSQTELQTAVSSYLTKGQNEVQWEKRKKKQIEVSRQFEASLLYSLDQAPAASASGSFSGLLDMIATNVTNVAGDVLDLSTLEDAFDSIMANDNSLDSFKIVCSRTGRRILNALFAQQGSRQLDAMTTELGVRIDRFQTPLADVEMLICPQLDNDQLIIVSKWDDIKILPIDTKNGSGWQEVTFDMADNNGLIEGWGYWGIFTLYVGNEKRHARVHTFDTTLSNYGGI